MPDGGVGEDDEHEIRNFHYADGFRLQKHRTNGIRKRLQEHKQKLAKLRLHVLAFPLAGDVDVDWVHALVEMVLVVILLEHDETGDALRHVA